MVRIRHRLRARSLLLSAALLLSGCAAGPGTGFAGLRPETQPPLQRIMVPQKMGESSRALQRAMDAATNGHLSDATRQIGLAIALDPQNPTLHFLNGLVYQLRAARGEPHYADLAESGYLIALQHQPDHVAAAVQLARLYFDLRRWHEAQRAAAWALEIDADNVDAARLLAAASYYQGDVSLGVWAMRRAKALDPGGAAASFEPLLYGAAGLQDEAGRAYQTLASLRPELDKDGWLRRRLRQWRDFHLAAQADEKGGGMPAPRHDAAVGLSSAPPSSAGAAPAAAGQQGPIAPSWSDCQPPANGPMSGYGSGGGYAGSYGYGSGYSSYGGASPSGDETAVLSALPSPCHGRTLPRMAMIDAVMLRTDDVTTNARGVNLLDGLSIFVQDSITSTKTYGANAPGAIDSKTILRSIGLGPTVNAGIAYSLNIANASDQRADILARPTLLVLDRQPAQFFSGSSVSVALVSNEGGGNLSDKPVGVSLSVTPTFVDDDTILLNVKAARSFFETTASTATFEQSVQTSRNMVQASVIMKFNQTLILSGLSERELTQDRSGVPMLRDLPGVQYLFNRQTTSDFTKSVLILLTPRKVSSFDDAVDAAENANRISRAAEPDPQAVLHLRETALKDLGGIWPNITATIGHMEKSNRFFRAIRTGDIRLEEWATSARLQRMLDEAISLVYH